MPWTLSSNHHRSFSQSFVCCVLTIPDHSIPPSLCQTIMMQGTRIKNSLRNATDAETGSERKEHAIIIRPTNVFVESSTDPELPPPFAFVDDEASGRMWCCFVYDRGKFSAPRNYDEGGKELVEPIDKQTIALSFHIQSCCLLDFTQLHSIYHYKTEEYSHTVVKKFYVIPESIPDWVFDFMIESGEYLIGNFSPACRDFRWLIVADFNASLSSATPAQATTIIDLIKWGWEDLIREMPLQITYLALEGHQRKIAHGCDPKNTQWSKASPKTGGLYLQFCYGYLKLHHSRQVGFKLQIEQWAGGAKPLQKLVA